MARRVIEAGWNAKSGNSGGSKPLEKIKKIDVLKEVKLEKYFGGVFSLQYNYDGSILAVGFSSGGVRLYNPVTGEMLKELRSNRHGGFAIMCLRFHPNHPEILYACTAEGHIYSLNTVDGTQQQIVIEAGNEINCMDFCLDGFNYATCGKDLAVRVYDTKSNKQTKIYEGAGTNLKLRGDPDMEAGNTMRVYALKFSPENEHIFISSGWDNHIKIWDIRTNDGMKRQISGPHVCGDSLDIKGKTILTGSWCANHALQEYDYTEGKLIRDLPFPHKNGAFLYCALYSGNDLCLAGGSGTNSAEILEISTGKHIGGVKMTRPVQAIDCAFNGRLFAVGGGDDLLKASMVRKRMSIIPPINVKDLENIDDPHLIVQEFRRRRSVAVVEDFPSSLSTTLSVPSHSKSTSLISRDERSNISSRSRSRRKSFSFAEYLNSRRQSTVIKKRLKSTTIPLSTKRKFWDSLFHLDPTIVGSIVQGFETKKSQLSSTFVHFKIWSHHFKEIEGTFGSAIASYFRFVRWLLFLNIFTVLVSFLIIVMPFFASSKPSSFMEWVDTSFNSSEINETASYSFAHQAQNCSKKYLNESQSSSIITEKILGFLIGTDWMATTSMFYGHYHNRTFSSEDDSYNYNMSLAYIMAIIVIFSVSFLLIVKNSSHSVKEAVISAKETSAVHFTNSVLCGWDYCIVSEKTAATKKRILQQEFKADLLDQIKRIERENRSRKERIQLLLVRIGVNILVLLILGGALYLIYFATDKLIEIKQQIKSNILRLIVEFTPSLAITILNVIVPEVFGALVKLEDYTPGFQIKISLFRTVLLRLSSLGVLIFSLYYTLELDTRNARQNCTEENTFNTLKCCGNLLWMSRNSTGTIVMCWETYVGQQFYKLSIVDFFATFLLTFVIEFPRKLIFDHFKDMSTFINTFGQQEFDIPQNVLDIVYTQNLCWLGVFFAPLLPCMTLFKVFCTFYMKKLSLMKNIAPPQHTFKASRSNSFFMTILLLSFILAASLVGYMIGNIGPSKSCGPFRLYSQEKYYVWSSIINVISSWPKGLANVLFFLGTAAFFIPVIVILCLLMYLFWTIGQGYKKMEEMLQERLKMEARDKQFLLARVNAIIKRGNEQLD